MSSQVKRKDDAFWWQEFGDRFGWTLQDFTHRHHAYFETAGRELIALSDRTRDEILEALKNASKWEWAQEERKRRARISGETE